MLTKEQEKNENYCIIVTSQFLRFFSENFFWKNENWTS